jgi:DNA helicase-2/ATP-dependent DNA helicase PcrA
LSLVDDLNEPQREAVLAAEGPLLVLAGAGSGKTRVLTYRIAHLILERGVAPRNILAFTFTNKAAGEMKERVAGLLGGSPRDLWVGTFHATGVRILRLKGRAVGIDPGFSIYDTDDQESLIRRILKDLEMAERDLTPKSVRSAVSSAKNVLMTPQEFEDRAESFRDQKIARVFAEYRTRLRSANALDFDDLIAEPIRLFDENPDVRDLFAERFHHVLVDEFQDTNPAQMRLIEQLASVHRNLCVVGDDDQSIYGWRGADVRNILSFEKLYPRARVVRLEQNYRSTGIILDAANAVVRHNRSRKEKTLWTDREGGDLLSLTLVGDAEEEAARVVAAVAEEVNRRRVPLAEVAVLYRTNAQSRALETAFRNAAVPYELVGGTAFYQRREIKDLLAYLRLLVNPDDDVAFSRVVNVPKRGIGTTSLERLGVHAYREGTSLYRSLATVEDAGEIPKGARGKLVAFRELIEEIKGRAGDPVDEVLKEIVERLGYLDFLEHDDPDTAYDRAENIEELVAGARLFAERNEGGDVNAFLNEVALLTDVDRVDEKAEKVRLMTIHNAKGLEFRVVCVSGLEEGLLPHASSLDDDDALEEERRLFYVALTRAKDRVHLYSAMTRQRWGGTTAALLSRFAEEIPDDLVRVEERPLPRSWSGASRPRRVERDRGAEIVEAGPRRSLGTILHPTFGRGDVVGQEGTGPDARLTVIFAGNVKKKIVARYAQWEDCHVDF